MASAASASSPKRWAWPSRSSPYTSGVEGGLLEPREEVRWIDYRLRAEALAELQGWLGQLAASCGRPASLCD
jgi:hypothetical protein